MNKVIVVTGSSSGFGKMGAEALAKTGHMEPALTPMEAENAD